MIFVGIGSLTNLSKAYPQSISQEKSYIIVFLTPRSNDGLAEDEIQIIDNDHLRNIGRLSENKILANAGPFEGGGEIMILNLNSGHEAEVLLSKDPLVQNKLVTYEILPLEIRTGSICEPSYPYEMRIYDFVRYTPTNQIASFKTNSDFEMKRLHEQYLKELLKTGEVILEGVFGGNDGGILIYNSSSKILPIENDPAISKGYLLAENKKIWLNKGSFCDK